MLNELLVMLSAQLSKDTLNKVAIAFTAAMATLMFLGIGLITIVADLILSSYHQSQLSLSQVSAVGGILILVPILMVGFALKKTKSPETETKKSLPDQNQLQLGPLSMAAAAFVMDIVEERKLNRTLAKTQQTEFGH